MDAGVTWASWHADPTIVVGTVAIVFWYALRARQLAGSDAAPRPRQVALFAAAVVSVLIALASPLHDLSETYLFTAHMGQHVLLIMVMPPLLLASLTPEMVRPLLGTNRTVRAVARWLTGPVVAYLACNVVFTVSHLPALYDLTLRTHAVHIAEHLVFMATAILLWWPLLSPQPELPRISYPAQLLYIFLQGLPGSIVGGLIANTERVIYPFYAAAPRITDLSPVQDHQLGAIVMWVGGGTFWLAAFTIVFFRWAALDMAEEARRGIIVPVGPPRSKH
jgi:putative membrane protein